MQSTCCLLFKADVLFIDADFVPNCGDADDLEALSAKLKQECNLIQCEAFTIVPGEWTECDKECDTGIQTRQISCMSSLGYPISHSMCNAMVIKTIPTFQLCNTQECPKFYYKYR